MFGFGKAKKEATQVGEMSSRMAIAPFWDFGTRQFDPRIWSDPYVLGLIQGSIAAQTMPITGRKLSTTDKGFVMLNAMRALGAHQLAIELSLNLAQAHDAEFMRGYDQAITTFLLMAGALKEDHYDEPDVVAAKAAVPSVRRASAFLNSEPRHPDEELASAYIFLKVNEHKDAHYPR